MRRIHTPAARASDPRSSHDAADAITASGERDAQQAKTVAAVRRFPGCTSMELAEKAGLDRYMLARRLGEVETAKCVRRGEPRECSISRRRVLTWWPTEASA